ncbi:hypothetical protein ZEAMMB73_Zm00001d025456 [Zea mays]|uniref:Uncharacterized protein n=1 Tax=Zea mays TaxID=4577 RepID=A0A1D6J775_MAIZE|nr:hypothetical protein ZEAMMB73_Zm00001d025456 [Zea mays]
MVGFGKLPKYHQDPITEELAKTLDCWPSMNYYITGCRYVSMCSFRMFNSSYLVLQAMTMWGNDRRMKFVGGCKDFSKKLCD